MGSYTRTSSKKDVVDRIDETVQDIGLSIFLTTLTSAIAFALGYVTITVINRRLNDLFLDAHRRFRLCFGSVNIAALPLSLFSSTS